MSINQKKKNFIIKYFVAQIFVILFTITFFEAAHSDFSLIISILNVTCNKTNFMNRFPSVSSNFYYLFHRKRYPLKLYPRDILDSVLIFFLDSSIDHLPKTKMVNILLSPCTHLRREEL